MNKSFIKKALAIFLLIFNPLLLNAQNIEGVKSDGSVANNIITAVPFLLIVPQARMGAMGNAGVAVVSADANAPSVNAAALAFLPTNSFGISLSYSPWLRNLTSDINLTFLSGYYRLNDRNTIAASLRYFTIGNVQFMDDNMENLGDFSPNEMSFDVNYARSFGDNLALGGGLRFIYSNLYNGTFSNGGQAQAGKALAVDISAIYKKETALFGTDAILSAGLALSNIGTKMNYSTGNAPFYLPANFKIGTAATMFSAENSQFTFAVDLNKLMVPTQPIYGTDGKIIKGEDPNRSVSAGTFGSFNDAPGGFKEELKETGVSVGLEYNYQQKIALRMGYNYQDPAKGNSKYFTVGAGFTYNILVIDLSYLAGETKQSPMANTLRFGLQLRFGTANNH